MQIEIDQSGKIENTSKDTIIAFSNGKSSSVKIPARVKRQLQDDFRSLGFPRLFVLRTFAATIAILIKDLKPETIITIDKEYPGREDVIKEYILEFGQKLASPKFDIVFSLIGKKSPAHSIAYLAYTKKMKVAKTLTLKELREILFSKKIRPRSR